MRARIFGESLIKNYIKESIPYEFVWDEEIQGDWIRLVSYGDSQNGGQHPLWIEIPGLKSWEKKGVFIDSQKIYEEAIDYLID